MSKIKIECAARNKTALPKHEKSKKGLGTKSPKPRRQVPKKSGVYGLSQDQKKTFTQCEASIENGLPATAEVAAAFNTILSEKLYREEYGSFQGYCKERWKLSRQQGYRLAEMGALNEELAATGNVIPSENLARLLKQVPKGQLAKVMARAKEIGGGEKFARKDCLAAIQEICPAESSNGNGNSKEAVVKLPTFEEAISVAQIRQWAEQALENLRNNTDKDETIELLAQVVSALFIIDGTKSAQRAA